MPVIVRETVLYEDMFFGARSMSTTADSHGWAIKDTSTAGAPTYASVNGDEGTLEVKLAADSEEEVITLYHKDILTFRLDQILYVEFVMQVSGFNSVTTLVAGIAGPARTTHAQLADAETYNAWFRIEGSVDVDNVVVETDDTVTDNDDKATGKTLVAAYKRFVIDFQYGLKDVRFYIDGDRVASTTTFDMSKTPTQRMQPYIDLRKASGTGVPAYLLPVYRIARKLVM